MNKKIEFKILKKDRDFAMKEGCFGNKNTNLI